MNTEEKCLKINPAIYEFAQDYLKKFLNEDVVEHICNFLKEPTLNIVLRKLKRRTLEYQERCDPFDHHTEEIAKHVANPIIIVHSFQTIGETTMVSFTYGSKIQYPQFRWDVHHTTIRPDKHMYGWFIGIYQKNKLNIFLAEEEGHITVEEVKGKKYFVILYSFYMRVELWDDKGNCLAFGHAYNEYDPITLKPSEEELPLVYQNESEISMVD